MREELGEETLIVLTADHGYGFDAPRYARNAYGYDLNTVTLHVPMLFAVPFIAPRRVSSLCSTLDLVPTLRNLLRLPELSGLRGYSLVPELIEGRTARPQLVMHQQYLPERYGTDKDPLLRVSVRTPQHNYVLHRDTHQAELWNYREDYAEQRELLRINAAPPELRAELANLAAAFVYESKRSLKLPHGAEPTPEPSGEKPGKLAGPGYSPQP